MCVWGSPFVALASYDVEQSYKDGYEYTSLIDSNISDGLRVILPLAQVVSANLPGLLKSALNIQRVGPRIFPVKVTK